MPKTDPQLKSNDGGISSIKTVFNLFNKNNSRRYIEQHLPLEAKGTRISDMKSFFETNGFNASLKLLDLNCIRQNPDQLKELIPFILPIKNKKAVKKAPANESRHLMRASGNTLKIVANKQVITTKIIAQLTDR